MKTLLYLDDNRDPYVWLNGDMLMITHKVFWVRSYDEFIEWIMMYGLPDMISFDHDLADEHYGSGSWDDEPSPIDYDSFDEMTGFDAAVWLANYCDRNSLRLPFYLVHSANPDGAENIRVYLKNAKKHLGI